MPIKSKVHKEVAMIAKGLANNTIRGESEVTSTIRDLLCALGWNTKVINCEVEQQRKISTSEFGKKPKFVDIALHSGNRNEPLVFIEAKSVGKINKDAVQQLFDYATAETVPFLILTDSRKWRFYFYLTTGNPAQKKFCEINISEDKESIDECAKAFRDYLSRRAITTGSAKKRAKKILEKRKEEQKNKDKNATLLSVSESWKSLLEEQPWQLRSLLQKKTTEKFPHLFDISNNIIKEFLSTQAQKTKGSGRTSLVVQPSKKTAKDSETSTHRGNKSADSPSLDGKIIGFIYDKKRHVFSYRKDVFFGALEQFSNKKEAFIKDFDAKSNSVNKNRLSLFKTDRSEKNLRNESKQLIVKGEIWWVYTNVGNGRIKDLLEKACEVMGIVYGVDFEILTESKD